MTSPEKLTFTPLYEQVKKAILERIIKGEWGPGSFLPSEIALAKEYGISQGTLRNALNALTREKRLVRYQGKGTAVAILDEDSALFPFFLYDDTHGKRVYPLSQVYDIANDKASKDERESLRLAKIARVIRISRVRIIHDIPVINEKITLPEERFPGFCMEKEKLPNTLYEYYQQNYGLTVARATDRMEAICPDESDITHLGIPHTHPLLLVKRIAFDLKNNILEYRVSHVNTLGSLVYRADLS